MNCAVAGTIWVSYDDSARMFIGCRMWVRARETIAAGMVAENSIVCRVSGVLASSLSTSGRKPRSSISSASSRTSDFTWEMSRARRFIRSISRPGVPTTTSTPLLERVELRLVGHAAVDGQDPDAAVLAGQGEVAGDLERELAGRGDDQRLRLAGRGELEVVGVVGGDGALQHRDAERQRLAGAGAGLADQVGAHQGDREGHLLDGEGGHDAGALERVADLGEHPELSEGVVRILPFYGCGPRALARRSSVGSCFGSPAVSGVNTPFPVSTLGPLRSKVVPRGAGRLASSYR